MKFRIVVVLGTIIALLFTGVAYAGQGNSNWNNENRNQNKLDTIEVNISDNQNSQQEYQASGRNGFGPGESAQALRDQIRERTRLIRQNEAECSQLKQQIRTRCQDLKQCIQQQQRQQGIQFTPEQAANIEESLALLQNRNKELENERLCYKNQMAQMKRNKNAGNKTELLEDLNEIISVQEERITALENTLNGLEDLEQTLL